MISQTTADQIRAYFTIYHKSKRWIANQLGVSRQVVRKYIQTNSPVMRVAREIRSVLEPYTEVAEELFYKYDGNCTKVCQNLEKLVGIKFNERTVRRFCSPWRADLKAQHSHIRFEVKPGQQMQIDFGEKDVMVGGELVRVHFFVAYMKYSRRVYVKAYMHENQGAWKDGAESAFQFFGGVPVAVLSDNSRCLVKEHQKGQAPVWNPGWENFSEYWGFIPIAASPRRPQTKGGVERMVRYVKENALVGESFKDMNELNLYLEKWCLTIADNRRLSHVFEGSKIPKERFIAEKEALLPLKAKTYSYREDWRKVGNDGLIRVDNMLYRVPDNVKNKDVQILIDNQTIQVYHLGKRIAELDKTKGVYPVKQQGYEKKEPVEVKMPYLPQYHVNPLQRSLMDYLSLLGGWNEKFKYC